MFVVKAYLPVNESFGELVISIRDFQAHCGVLISTFGNSKISFIETKTFI